MGIAIAAGVPPSMGLVSGIVGGIIVGAMAGSPLSVTGPAASLIVIVYETAQQFGLAGLALAVTIGGLLQVAGGLLGAAQWFRAVAPSVIAGMLSGIGVLIFASQFHVMVDDEPAASGLVNLVTIPRALVLGLSFTDGQPHHLAAMIGVLTLVTLIAWNALRERTSTFLRTLPAPLLAVGVGTGVAQLLSLPIRYVTVPTDFGDFIRLPEPGVLSLLLEPGLLGAAFAIGAIASAASLFSVAAVDKMHKGPRANFDRELIAQGVGNMVCGLVGGLPMTAVIVRSTANVQAGATTRLSAIAHGFWLLLTVTALPFVLSAIPIATLAAVLVYIGAKLVDVRTARELASRSWGSFFIFAATLGIIVSVSLVAGLVTGVLLACGKLLYTFSHIEIAVTERAPRIYDVSLKGAATFIRLPPLARALEALPLDAEVHVHVEDLDYIDHACIELFSEQRRQREDGGGLLIVEWDELNARTQRVLRRAPA